MIHLDARVPIISSISIWLHASYMDVCTEMQCLYIRGTSPRSRPCCNSLALHVTFRVAKETGVEVQNYSRRSGWKGRYRTAACPAVRGPSRSYFGVTANRDNKYREPGLYNNNSVVPSRLIITGPPYGFLFSSAYQNTLRKSCHCGVFWSTLCFMLISPVVSPVIA